MVLGGDRPSLKMPLWLPEGSSTPDRPHHICAQGQVCSWDQPGGAVHNLDPETSRETGQGNCSDDSQTSDALRNSMQGTGLVQAGVLLQLLDSQQITKKKKKDLQLEGGKSVSS